MGHGAYVGQKPRHISAPSLKVSSCGLSEYDGLPLGPEIKGAGSKVLCEARGDASSGQNVHPYRVKKGRKLAAKRPSLQRWERP